MLGIRKPKMIETSIAMNKFGLGGDLASHPAITRETGCSHSCKSSVLGLAEAHDWPRALRSFSSLQSISGRCSSFSASSA